jgi:UDP-N-acetylmuramoylalanine--D-glutamate ligase
VELQGARATVVGLGASGLAAARLLIARGAQVTINDARDAAALGAKADEARALGAALELGGHDAERLAEAQLIVVSPGVPALPALEAAETKGVKLVSEVELASWFLKSTLIGITGTNGKSTVTSLIGEMCKAAGRPTFVGGNLGTPLVDAVGTPAGERDGVAVVELSSFQLERIERFRAHIGVLLNVTDDHLDRYPSFAAYAAAKARLFATQLRADFALVPDGDALCTSLARASAAQLLTFAGKAGAVRRDGERLIDPESGLSLAVSEIGIKGDHNIDNACAAALAARLAGVERAHIERVLREFRGLGHRMQYAGAIGEVSFYDDSKATNVGAAVAAVLGFGRQGVRVVLIAGGKDKGGSYGPLREVMERHGRGLITIGEAAPLIEAEFRETSLRQRRAVSMREAVRAAHQLAHPTDAVLLAPACASFDMFRSYAHRGDVFCAEVAALQKELAP